MAKAATDTESIQSTLQGIGSQISAAVNTYADRSGISEQQPVFLDAAMNYPLECLALISRILGGSDYTRSGRQERFTTFHQTNTSLIMFLRSFVGKALNDWCLNASDQAEEIWYSHLGEGDVQSTLEKG